MEQVLGPTYALDIGSLRRCSDGHTLLTWAIRNGWGDLMTLLLSGSGLTAEDLSYALAATVKRGLVTETVLTLLALLVQ